MERKFIWFNTGIGCLASVLSLVVATAVLILGYPHISASPLLFAAAVFFVLLGTLWFTFYIEWRMRLRSRAERVRGNSDRK